MIEITKDNYKDIDFNGVIISVPRKHLKDELTQDFSLHFECAYRTQGKHGYKEPGHNPDSSSFFSIWYGDNDMPNGFGFNSTSRLPWEEEYLHFNNVKYYKFNDMIEFCTWYLQQNGREIWIDDGENKARVHNIDLKISINKDKEWIHEKCGTNTPPTKVPIIPKYILNEEQLKAFMNPEYRKRCNQPFMKEIQTYVQKILNIRDCKNFYDKTGDIRFKEKMEEKQKELQTWLEEEI